MNDARRLLTRSGLLAGATLCASLLAPAHAVAQDQPVDAALAERRTEQAAAADPALDPARRRAAEAGAAGAADAAATDIDLAEAPQVAGLLQDEAIHRDRLARIHRLRELATRGNLRERLAQLDDLERRELQRHEARVLLHRSQLSERSARGYDNLVQRGGSFHARGRDIATARKRKFGTSGDGAVRRDGTPDRSASRPTRSGSSPAPRAPARSTGRGGRSPR